MKTKTFLAFTALIAGAAGLSIGLIAADKKTVHPKAELKVDSTPVAAVKSNVVTSYADVLDPVRPAVVSVYSSKLVRQRIPEVWRQMGLQGREQLQRGMGSGVIVSADGYILTNNHVVEEADEVKVMLNDDREFTAKIIGTDPKTDVAVIKIEGEKLPAVTLADSGTLRVGDVVFAIGNPLGVGQTVTMGIVSATSRRIGILGDVEGYEDFIQTDAAINQGNSGGALVDARGRLVGINSAILSTSQGNIGIGFAIPINLASSIMNSLIETGSVTRGYLGVSSSQLTPDIAEAFKLPRDTKGVVIMDLPADGPAAKAGFKVEDIIVAINGRPVNSADDLRLTIAQFAPGTTISVDYLRDGKRATKEATLVQRPDDGIPTGELLPGVSVESLTPELRRTYRVGGDVEGLVVTQIGDKSAYQGVFAEGMVVVSINREAVIDVVSARQLIRPGRNLAFVYYRGGFRYVTFVTR